MKVTSMQNEIPKIIPILQRSFQDEGIPIACFFYSDDLPQMPAFSVYRLWYTFADSRPNRLSKWTHNLLIKWSHFNKNMSVLMLLFQDEEHLYTSCLFYILLFTIN